MKLNDIDLFFLNLKHEGLFETIRRIGFRFLRANKFFIFCLDLTGPIQTISLPTGFSAKEISSKELIYLRNSSEPLPSEFYREGIAPHDRCFVCLNSGELSFISWISTQNAYDFMNMDQGGIEQYYNFCLERFRGCNLYPAITIFLAKKLKEEGYKNLWTTIHDENIAALKGAKKIGFNKVHVIKRWGIFTWLISQK